MMTMGYGAGAGAGAGAGMMPSQPYYPAAVASPQDWTYGAAAAATPTPPGFDPAGMTQTGGYGAAPYPPGSLQATPDQVAQWESMRPEDLTPAQVQAIFQNFNSKIDDMEEQDIKDYTLMVQEGEALSLQAQRILARLGPNRSHVYLYSVGPGDEPPEDVEVFPGFYNRREGIVYQAHEALEHLASLLPANARRGDRKGPQVVSFIASDLANTRGEKKWEWNEQPLSEVTDKKRRQFNIIAEDSKKGGSAPTEEEIEQQLKRRENFYAQKYQTDNVLIDQMPMATPDA